MEACYWLVVLGVILLYFQLFLGRICRWRREWFLAWLADAAYKLPYVVGIIALTAIQCEDSTAVWILYLTVLNNSMVVYDRESKKVQALWTLINVGIFLGRAVHVALCSGLRGAAGNLAIGIVVITVLASAGCNFIAGDAASFSRSCSEKIVKYMKNEAFRGGQYDAITLKGYRYLVHWERGTTVEQIYMNMAGENGDLEANIQEEEAGLEQRRKDICLSFTLFLLLFRRYFGLPCDEANHPMTRALVLNGLLLPHDDDQDRRGAGVIAAELGFLHDHVHGGDVLWSHVVRNCYRGIAAVKALLMYIGAPVIYYGSQGSVHASNLVIILFLLHGILDLLQIILYYRSDRWLVSYMCDPDAWHFRYFHWLIKLIRWRKFNCSYWHDMIGQYSLLDETTRTRGVGCNLLRQQSWISDLNHVVLESAPIGLPAPLMVSIARVLRSWKGKLNGVPSLKRARQIPKSKRRCDDKDTQKIKVLMRWHIATSYCEMALQVSDGEPPNPTSSSYEVAKALSRYCAYLVAFRPQLLPQVQSFTERTFYEVLKEIIMLVGNNKVSVDSRFTMLENRRQAGDISNSSSTLSDGLDLGYLLINQIDRNELWTILENIWVKMILSLAPQRSQDACHAESHAKYLAEGGEFVTHLWAILSNAGILEQNPWPRKRQVYERPEWFIKELRKKYL